MSSQSVSEIVKKNGVLPRKTYRKMRKKERRKLKRQERAKREAEETPKNEENERLQEALLACQIEREAEESRVQNLLWLEREATAQEEFARKQQELEQLKETQEAARRRQAQHQESLIRAREALRKEKLDRIQANILRDFRLQEQIDAFLGGSATIPDELLKNAESNPGREVCNYFRRTSACRFGDGCVKNHIRPGLSKIILISNFFDHIRLSRGITTEHGDFNLEFEDQELEEAFVEFFADACFELEKFGTVEKFFVCRNPMPHLRGRAFVEYTDMRESLAALKAINGRYYGGRQLGVEFSGIQAWSEAICALLFIFVIFMPESPVWLKTKNRLEEAQSSIDWLHLSGITLTPNEGPPAKDKLISYKALFSRACLMPLGIGLGLLIIQQISGIDAVIFFTVEIFKTAGSSLNSYAATIIVGAVQLASNFASLFIVDKAGRKPLLITSAVIMCISMASMGVAYHLHDMGDTRFGYLPLLSLIVFMVGFSLGFGIIPFLLMGELFPTQQRSFLSSIAGSFNLLAMFIVIVTYHPLEELITAAGTFWMYSLFCALGVLFVIFLVPETKGQELESIASLFIRRISVALSRKPSMRRAEEGTVPKQES